MIHIFYMRFDTSVSNLKKDLYMQFLSDERKQRVHQKKSSEAAMKCMQTGLFLRYGLERTGYGKVYNDILVREDGKPEIAGNPVYFNLSHSGEYVVLVIADCMCGIDIQEPVIAKERLIKHVLHANEYRLIEACDERDTDKRSKILTQFWCLKEAYLKYTGEGIRFAMSRLDLSPVYEPQLIPIMNLTGNIGWKSMPMDSDHQKMVNIKSFMLDQYVVSICIDKPMYIDESTALSAEQLFSHFNVK